MKQPMQENNLFNLQEEKSRPAPLAELMRPKTMDDFLGQEDVLGAGMPLRNLIESHQLISLIFWGLPGVGKTTLARIIANGSDANFIELSAVNSGIKELRDAVTQAQESLRFHGKATVVFIDEIHRYSKTQQDAILPYVENGAIILMGATTENPSFQVIPALLSRVLLVRLNPLSREDIKQLVRRGLDFLNHPPTLPYPPRGEGTSSLLQGSNSERSSTLNTQASEEATGFITDYANGDARSALNLLETAFKCAPRIVLDDEKTIREIPLALLEQLAQQNRLNYDRQGDEHYDHASAYQKSMRGGDANAAIYWLGKMIAGGEDPRFIARRLMVTASEDVGLADPQAFQLAVAATEAVERLGLPEGRIPLALATIYTAQAAKSNAAIVAIDAALDDIQHKGHNYAVPAHLRDSHYQGAKSYGHGVGYVYTHDDPLRPQAFLPHELQGKQYVNSEQ